MAGRPLLFTRSLLQNLRRVRALRAPPAFSGCYSEAGILSCADDTMRARHFSSLQPGVIRTENMTVLKTPVRWKSKKTKKGAEEEQLDDDDEEGDDDDEEGGVLSDNEISAYVSSMRIDSILKGGINMSKTRAAEALYKGSIRVNGSKPLKKSQQVDIGDEVDYIVGFVPENPNLMQVHRVTVLKVFTDKLTDSGKFKVQLRRQRNLVIERYEDYEDS